MNKNKMYKTRLILFVEGPDSSKNLLFMPQSEATKKGIALLQSLQLSCVPEANPKMVSITGEELNNFQTELLKNPSYRDFPKTKVLKDLSEKDDAYYLQFTFQKDGLPIYGPDTEPSISMRNGDMLLPFSMRAMMMITSQGLRYLRVYQALSINGKASDPKRWTEPAPTDGCKKKASSHRIKMNCFRLNGQEKESPLAEYHRFTQAGAFFQSVSALFLTEYAYCCRNRYNHQLFALLHQMTLACACKYILF